MSYIQYLEEQQYDTQTEYIAVLRAEAFDPYEHETYCEEHDFLSFDGHCDYCPERPTAGEYIPDLQTEFAPPF